MPRIQNLLYLVLRNSIRDLRWPVPSLKLVCSVRVQEVGVKDQVNTPLRRQLQPECHLAFSNDPRNLEGTEPFIIEFPVADDSPLHEVPNPDTSSIRHPKDVVTEFSKQTSKHSKEGGKALNEKRLRVVENALEEE